jgi:hypothetical protein
VKIIVELESKGRSPGSRPFLEGVVRVLKDGVPAMSNWEGAESLLHLQTFGVSDYSMKKYLS